MRHTLIGVGNGDTRSLRTDVCKGSGRSGESERAGQELAHLKNGSKSKMHLLLRLLAVPPQRA
jgi:hypothetical protein